MGYDNIDLNGANRLGVFVTNTPDALTETTADFAWALIMALARRVAEADLYIREGRWKVSWHPEMLAGRDVYGPPWVLWALGG